MLQTETTKFQRWMSSWFGSASTADPTTAVAQFKQETDAYDGWISAWLSSVNAGSTAPAPVHFPVPGKFRSRRANTGSVAVPSVELQLLQLETTSFEGWTAAWINSTEYESFATSVAQLQQEMQAYNGWIKAWVC